MAKKHASQAGTSFSAELLKATAASAIEAVNTVGADEQADLVEAWVAAGNVEAVARVAGEDEAPAPARKAARRGLNVLKSRGIRVPEKSTVAKPFAAVAERTIEARFLPTDGSGQAVLSILARTAGKDTHLCDVVYADGPGILRVSGGWLSNHKLREWENDSKRARGFAHAEVPVSWARWRINELRKQNASSGYLLPLEIDQFADLLSPVPEAEPPHPATQLDLGEISNADVRVAQSASLHLEPEFRSFLVSRQAIGEVLTHVGAKLAQAGSEPTQEALDPILAEELKAAVDRFFEPDVRKQLADRMLDAALSIARRAGKERALDVLATRQAVLNAGLITQPPREIPFLRAFYEKTLAILASQSNGQLSIPMPARPQPSGPVLSAEQLAAIQAAKEQQPEQPLANRAPSEVGGSFPEEAATTKPGFSAGLVSFRARPGSCRTASSLPADRLPAAVASGKVPTVSIVGDKKTPPPLPQQRRGPGASGPGRISGS